MEYPCSCCQAAGVCWWRTPSAFLTRCSRRRFRCLQQCQNAETVAFTDIAFPAAGALSAGSLYHPRNMWMSLLQALADARRSVRRGPWTGGLRNALSAKMTTQWPGRSGRQGWGGRDQLHMPLRQTELPSACCCAAFRLASSLALSSDLVLQAAASIQALTPFPLQDNAYAH